MTRDLAGARDAELELSVRKREVELASGVREALLPLVTPELPGYDVGGAQLVSDEMGGDLFDYVELSGGRLGLLVCDVSGRGLPAALIGATARSYLRSELRQGEDVKAALCRVNRELVQDVRRGMFVTALYAVVDPRSHEVDVYCAGHKLPLLRYVAAERKLRLVHPEGIALGFDQGPVFERSIEVQRFRLEPGDRLLLANTAPVRLAGGAGTELGEKGFYQLVLRNSAQPTPQFLKSLRKGLEEACGGERFPADISLVTILREG
jgi:sigma-B regulation protein RsbU (phosphoserine phosphatase)